MILTLPHTAAALALAYLKKGDNSACQFSDRGNDQLTLKPGVETVDRTRASRSIASCPEVRTPSASANPRLQLSRTNPG